MIRHGGLEVFEITQLGLRGRLPKYIVEFMKERTCKMAVNWAELGEKGQE